MSCVLCAAGCATLPLLSPCCSQVLVAVLEHPADSDRIEMQEELVGFMVAAGTIGRVANVFSLYDQPIKDAARPVPPHVLQVRKASAVAPSLGRAC